MNVSIWALLWHLLPWWVCLLSRRVTLRSKHKSCCSLSEPRSGEARIICQILCQIGATVIELSYPLEHPSIAQLHKEGPV